MSLLKKLAGETAIYGMTTILGRLLNYLLVPIHTRVFAEEEYGVITDLYAYAGFFIILFSYRMETAYFRQASQPELRNKAFATASASLLVSTGILCGLLVLFSHSLSVELQYPHHQDALIYLVMVLGLDALTAIPFARLRMEGKAWIFGRLKLINIGVNVVGNLFFLVVCPWLLEAGHEWVLSIYNPDIGIGYVFFVNMLASLSTFALLLPMYFKAEPSLAPATPPAHTETPLGENPLEDSPAESPTEVPAPQPAGHNAAPTGFFLFSHFDKALWEKMMLYALPLVFVGLAGMVNEVLDRILLKYLLPGDIQHRLTQLGIYGACYKLSILMTLFTQAFNYASEPFFFRHSGQDNAKMLYARVARAFAIVGSVVFLGVMLYLDIIQYFIGAGAYREGLGVVPILLMANLCLGLYYNVGVWYKLTDRTMTGAWIALAGAGVTIALNVLLIPRIGYMGSAWATLACYAFMLVTTWAVGRKYFPVPYEIGRIGLYIGAALAGYVGSVLLQESLEAGLVLKLLMNTIIFGGFIYYIVETEGLRKYLARR